MIEPLQDIWGVNLVSDIKADNTAVMFGEKVHCIGADKVNQVNRLRGSSIKYCYYSLKESDQELYFTANIGDLLIFADITEPVPVTLQEFQALRDKYKTTGALLLRRRLISVSDQTESRGKQTILR